MDDIASSSFEQLPALPPRGCYYLSPETPESISGACPGRVFLGRVRDGGVAPLGKQAHETV
eukprot:908012-Alexandrium_andersonii.AAC.1